MLSAGHDGNIFIWDITKGTKTKHYFNMVRVPLLLFFFNSTFCQHTVVCSGTILKNHHQHSTCILTAIFFFFKAKIEFRLSLELLLLNFLDTITIGAM